jgi:ABC-type Fe3+-hydroxamate transport system substrate-binding protein
MIAFLRFDQPRPVAAALFLGLSLTSCGQDSTAQDLPRGALNHEFPMHLRDWAGEELTVPEPPQRILPLNASAVDALNVLVEPGRVVGLPQTALNYSTLLNDREAWLALSRYEETSATALLGYEPDFVISHEWQAATALPYLRRADVPVLVLPMPKSLDDACAQVTLLGEVLDCSDRAAALLADIERRRAALIETSASRSEVRVLGYSNYGTGGWAAGQGTTVDIVIALAGMQNAARDAELENFQEINYEVLLRMDPDLILVEDADGGAAGPTESLLMSEPALSRLRAVTTGGIARLPRRLSSTTSHQMIEAAEMLAEAAAEWQEAKQ